MKSFYIAMKTQQKTHVATIRVPTGIHLWNIKSCYLKAKITLYTKVQNKGKRQCKNKNQILQERHGVLKKHEKVDLVK